LQLNKK